MPGILGKVEYNGQVLIADVLIWIDEPEADYTVVLTNWSGSFELPADFPIPNFVDFCNNSRDSCRIILNDGRTGGIIVNPVGLVLPALVTFLGAGSLQ